MPDTRYDLVAVVGKYMHNGEQKNRFQKCGALWHKEDGRIRVKIDALPVGGVEWDGYMDAKPPLDSRSNPKLAAAMGLPATNEDDIPF
jgi:hypothetical protein